MSTCRPGTKVQHEADDVRRYLNVDACPAHSPAAVESREPSGRTAYHLGPRSIADSYPNRRTT